MEGILLRV